MYTCLVSMHVCQIICICACTYMCEQTVELLCTHACMHVCLPVTIYLCMCLCDFAVRLCISSLSVQQHTRTKLTNATRRKPACCFFSKTVINECRREGRLCTHFCLWLLKEVHLDISAPPAFGIINSSTYHHC